MSDLLFQFQCGFIFLADNHSPLKQSLFPTQVDKTNYKRPINSFLQQKVSFKVRNNDNERCTYWTHSSVVHDIRSFEIETIAFIF